MNDTYYRSLIKSLDVTLHEQENLGASIDFPISIPSDHHKLLAFSNGLEAYGGYFRLFGVGSKRTDMIFWNSREVWKFAWGSRCLPYWCFGSTAWGDQYAYNIEKLKHGDQSVYFLDCLSMTPSIIAPSFTEFLKNEFLRNASDPYDELTVLARHHFGDLQLNDGLLYAPSPLIGGAEKIENVLKMDHISVMIINGDIAQQIDNIPAHASIKKVEHYKDFDGRFTVNLLI